MKEQALQLLDGLETQLKEIELSKKEKIERLEDSIMITISILESLKTIFVKFKFESKKDEISFFKEIKPKFVSKLIYYNEIYNIVSNQPFGGQKALRKYYTGELAKLKLYFRENIEFYKYYRNGNTYLDNRYFVRGKYDIKLTLDSFYFQADNRFSTSHDFKVAKIMANDLIQNYLENEIAKLENKAPLFNLTERQVQKWTGTKIALIELIYALHAEGVFNNGASDLKETAKFFEEIFDVDLGQFHRTFFEMRARKADRTKFLNSLRDTLLRKMDEVDE
jgi:hypothetical protein